MFALVPRYMAASVADPMFEWSRRMDEMLSRFYGNGSSWQPAAAPQAAWAPAVEIYTRGNKEYVIRFDVPGVDPKEIQLNVQGRVLTIAGERKSEAQHGEAWYSGAPSGRFQRSVVLPEGIDPSAVHAWSRHGVLEVTVPLPDSQREHTIPVQST